MLISMIVILIFNIYEEDELDISNSISSSHE